MAWNPNYFKPSNFLWIPVYTALPESQECVLITTEHNHFDDGSGDWKEVNYAYYDNVNNEWCSLAIDGTYEVYENVTAWMPLPEPFVDKNLESEEN